MSHILFLSDFHLGVPDALSSKEREIKICTLIDSYKDNLSEIFLVGDVFDFWMEYKTCVPKGFYRLFGKLAELADKNIPIHFFTGNHDMWMKDLFKSEFNANIHHKSEIIERQGKKIYIAHGDGLGPGDTKYKLLKVFFASPVCQFLFRWIHPDIGIKLACFFSYQSRYGNNKTQERYHGNAKEWLYIHCKEVMKKDTFDYFIFGHRHLPIYTSIGPAESVYINLGDWLDYNTYGIMTDGQISLLQYETNKSNRDFDPNR
jgi:UDP-2,3-diacylglucosamine hydrolase